MHCHPFGLVSSMTLNMIVHCCFNIHFFYELILASFTCLSHLHFPFSEFSFHTLRLFFYQVVDLFFYWSVSVHFKFRKVALRSCNNFLRLPFLLLLLCLECFLLPCISLVFWPLGFILERFVVINSYMFSFCPL